MKYLQPNKDNSVKLKEQLFWTWTQRYNPFASAHVELYWNLHRKLYWKYYIVLCTI